MKKLLIVGAVAMFVLGGATMVLAQTEGTVEPPGPAGRAFGALSDIIDDLVSDGTLTRDQADSILGAVENKREEVVNRREGVRQQLREAWSDGELTKAEVDQLPEGHPWRQVFDAFEDDRITIEELKTFRRFRWGAGIRPQDS